MKTGSDLAIGVIAFATSTALDGWNALITASGAAIYLICKGIVLVVKEYRRKQYYRIPHRPKIKAE